jgi:putative nucleotidyltransferase with HDIG domain
VGPPKPIGIADLIPLEENKRIAQEATRLAGVFDKELRRGVKGYLLAVFARGAPLYRYDAAATGTDVENAVAAIRAHPPGEAYKHYPAGELLVQRTSLRAGGTFQGLSAAELELLRHEHEENLRSEREKKPWVPWTRILGRAGILLVVSVLLCLYVAHFQRRILTNHWRGFAIVGVLLLMLGVNKVMSDVLNLNPHTAILPVLMAAIIFTIAYDQGFAITLGLILSILVVLQLRMDSALFVVLVAALTIGVFQLHEIRSRSKLIVAAAVTGGVVFATIWAAAMFRSVPWDFALLDGLWGLGATLLGGLLIQAALPLIERTFRIATSMTLLEWCDASKPLLKRLAMEAPGTYNHSLQLGAMCEVAAETVGARGLLARVGAYFHDVGKINKPEYFVENQSSAPSKHAKLSPAMSLLVIIGHVKDGLEMARRYALPSVLREFIAAHHGTTLVQYFYKAATEQRKTDTQRAPEEAEFRYPGPKPRSKEVAILMLADAAESSVRAITEPTPGRIENQVHTMVNRRLMDGQLDECDLTLKEVHQIEGSLTKSLCGIYHARIAYPPPTGEKPWTE